MRIEKTQRIAGQPAVLVRQLLRDFGDVPHDMAFVIRRLQGARAQAQRLLGTLCRLGYLERQAERGGPPAWRRTLQGSRLALASAARPLSRATAERTLQAFLARVAEVNRRPDFLYRVTKVVLFGSYLSEADRLNDVDVALALASKERDPKRRLALELAHTTQAEAGGRRFPTKLEALAWPQREVLLFLKGRSRALSVHAIDDAILQQTASRVVFEDIENGPAR